MDTASFYGILRTLAILILAYYAIRFLMRLFAPVIIQQVVKKAEQNFYEQHRQYQDQPRSEYSSVNEKPKEKKKVGEYIDYEEIE